MVVLDTSLGPMIARNGTEKLWYNGLFAFRCWVKAISALLTTILVRVSEDKGNEDNQATAHLELRL